MARDRRRVARAAGRDAYSGTVPVAETGNNPQDGVRALHHGGLVARGFERAQKEKAIMEFVYRCSAESALSVCDTIYTPNQENITGPVELNSSHGTFIGSFHLDHWQQFARPSVEHRRFTLLKQIC